jgi:predicted secreted protein
VGADIDGEAFGYWFGTSVSLSSDGKTVAIGAYNNDGNGNRNGHVLIFQWTESTSTWTQVGADIDGEASDDLFGRSASLSSDGKTVAIGAYHITNGNGPGSGHVRIFKWNYE